MKLDQRRKPKVYYYKTKEVGVSWPGHDVKSRTERNRPPRFRTRLPGFEATNDPNKADVFFLRQRRCWLTEEEIRDLPYLKGNEKRHIFWDLGSDSDPNCYRVFPDIPSIYFNACTTKDLLEKGPHMIAWPWPVEDFGDYASVPESGFRYDVVFQGQAPNELNRVTLRSVEKNPKLESYIKPVEQFWPYIRQFDPERAESLRSSYLHTMRVGRLHLCPTSVPKGIIRYRLYEGMSMARVGVLLGDGCVLPHEDKIHWADCIIRIREEDAQYTGDILMEWLSGPAHRDIIEMGRYARRMWKRWCKRENWENVFEAIVRERLGL